MHRKELSSSNRDPAPPTPDLPKIRFYLAFHDVHDIPRGMDQSRLYRLCSRINR